MEAGHPREALCILPEPARAYPRHMAEVMLLIAEAHRQLGSMSEAQDWLQQASDLIETHHLERLRQQVHSLSQRF